MGFSLGHSYLHTFPAMQTSLNSGPLREYSHLRIFLNISAGVAVGKGSCPDNLEFKGSNNLNSFS